MSKSKAIGTAYESEVQNRIINDGCPAFRLALNGNKDIGDILAIGPNGLTFLECKARSKSIGKADINKWRNESINEIANIKNIYGITEFNFILIYKNLKTNEEVTEELKKTPQRAKKGGSVLSQEEERSEEASEEDYTPEIKSIPKATAKQIKYIYTIATELAGKLITTPKNIIREVQISAGLRTSQMKQTTKDEAKIIIEELQSLKKEIEQ